MASSFSINRKIEPIDAEIIAISRAIKACHQQASTKFANNLIVYTDNKTAAGIVNVKRTLTSRNEAAEISMYKRGGIVEKNSHTSKLGTFLASGSPAAREFQRTKKQIG